MVEVNVKSWCCTVPECFRDTSFACSMKMYFQHFLKSGNFIRDYGTTSKTILLDDTEKLKQFIEEKVQHWIRMQNEISLKYLTFSKKKRKKQGDQSLEEYIADFQIKAFKNVFGGWKEIALTMRSRVFEDNEEEDIDIFDLKWNKYSLTTMQRNCYFCGYAFAMPKRPYKKASVSVSVYIDDLPSLHYDESTWDGIFIEKKKQLDYLEKFSANQTCQAILFPATPQFYANQTCQAILFPATPQFYANQTCRAILFPATPQFYANQTCQAILFPATPQFYANQTCQAILFPATPHSSTPIKPVEPSSSLPPHSSTPIKPVKPSSSLPPHSSTPIKPVKPSSSLPPHSSTPIKPVGPSSSLPPHSSTPIKPVEPSSSLPPHSSTPIKPVEPSSSLPPHSSTPIKPVDLSYSAAPKKIPKDVCSPLSIPTSLPRLSVHQFLSPNCSRSDMAKCKLPPVDIYLDVSKVKLAKVPVSFAFTDVASLYSRPTGNVVDRALQVYRYATMSKLHSKEIDLSEVTDEVFGVQFGHLGIFSRKGIEELEKMCKYASIHLDLKSEKKWIVETPDTLDDQKRDLILRCLEDYHPEHILCQENGHSITTQAFSYLALERYVDDTIINFFLARYQRQCCPTDSVVAFPAHAVVWLETGDQDFIQQCFHEILSTVVPHLIRLIIVPVNLADAHWGLFIIDIPNKLAYFDDGLGWRPPPISFVHDVVRVLHDEFPDIPDFDIKKWKSVTYFLRFGMPRQPKKISGRSGLIGSGSCGVGVILAAKDFSSSEDSRDVSFSWTFSDMTYHRKQLMFELLKYS
ncbi:hypothetical protein QZH41_016377 [Actinostola sp. cb2023]|nr:hypothetical protein QZH41_016377 [Actinostola sp. cb2023]